MEKKRKKWPFVLIILAVLAAAGFICVRQVMERRRPTSVPLRREGLTDSGASADGSSGAEAIEEEELSVPVTYTNYVLVGLDVRDQSELKQANSDTMIIASINNATGDVRLTAIYRDTLLNIYKKDGDERVDRLIAKDREIRAAYPADSPAGTDAATDTDSQSGAEQMPESWTAPVPVEEAYQDALAILRGEPQESVPSGSGVSAAGAVGAADVPVENAYRAAMEELLQEAAPADLGRYDKANAAYANGGADRLIWMLENNLDINIDGYFVVTFSAVADVVDDLGGIDVWMTEQEIIHMNNYCVETSEVTGKDYTPIEPEKEARDYHLNGVQAVSYARIRYTAGNDMKRSQRQRVVINKIADKASQNGLTALKAIIRHILPNCLTSISILDLFSYAANARSYRIEKTTGFPFEHIEQHCWPNGEELDPVVPVTLEENVREFHEFLYDDDHYIPSLPVRVFSRGIEDITGLGEANRADAEKNSVIGASGGEADVVR